MTTKAPARNVNGSLQLTNSFNDFFRPWNELFPEPVLERSLTIPAVNIAETEKSYNLSVAAPGLDKDDFNIEVQGKVLTISAEREESKEDNREDYSRREYNYSSFCRSFTLPEGVKQEGIDAEYKGGVLHVNLPKNKEAQKAAGMKVKVK